MNLDLSKLNKFVSNEQIDKLKETALNANKALENGTGKGNDFLGWVNLPSQIETTEIDQIKAIASEFQQKMEIVVVIGIGGSYLGSKAVIEALSNSFQPIVKDRKHPLVLFAGQNISEDYMVEMLEVLEEKSFGLVIISKSGTTTEPALAFRFLKKELETRYGKAEASHRIVAITDAEKGALRTLSTQENYRTFVIDDNIGGRYSVLTAVGLLPIAIAGFDVDELINGAKKQEADTKQSNSFDTNLAAQYAVVRNLLYAQEKDIEILVNYHPKLQYFSEWWKQLYGESEGKELKGIFPASVNNTADLHSMGQYIQEGRRNLFETIISINEPNKKLIIESDEANLDQLNYLTGKRVDEVNKMAELGTLLAHQEGGVPNIRIEIEKLNEFALGELIYFFEKACGISGYILDVNPFDQPGVEAYKRNMFALLRKPGFEGEAEKLLAD